jgi:uncharacterized membrane protein
MTTNNDANAQNEKQFRNFSRLSALAAGLFMPLMYLAFVPVLRRLAHGAPGGWVGFRTAASTSSIENWQLAQSLAANHFLILGLGFLVIAALCYLLIARFAPENSKLWAWVGFGLLALQMVALGVSTFIIERALPPVTGGAPLAVADNWGMPVFFGLLTPIMLIFAGPFMRHLASKNPNFASGYRTPGSMQSPQHWALANNLAAGISVWIGIVTTILAVIAFVWLWLNNNQSTNTWWYVSLFFAVAPLLAFAATIPFIEARLKRL